MGTKRRRSTKSKRNKSRGGVTFHGSYASKSDAVAKERKRAGAYIIKRKVRGKRGGVRYIVMSNDAPF